MIKIKRQLTSGIIEGNDVTKKYKKVTALNEVSFSVKRNSITALVGSNGAGKTTLMRLFLNIIPKNAGTIKIDGLDSVNNYRAIRKMIGYLPEERGINEHYKPYEWMRFFSDVYKIKNWKQIFDGYLREFELWDFRKKTMETLSKGMKQKMAFIRLLMVPSKILILDEPSSGMDPLAVVQLKQKIMQFKKEGKTILLSTHQLSFAEDICEDIIVLNKGKKLFEGNISSFKKKGRFNNIEKAYIKLMRADYESYTSPV